MGIQIDIEVTCDGEHCNKVGFAGSYYTLTEIYEDLKDQGWIKKRRKGAIINKWFFYCPECQENISKST